MKTTTATTKIRALLFLFVLVILKTDFIKAGDGNNNNNKRKKNFEEKVLKSMECFAIDEDSNSFRCTKYPKTIQPIQCINEHEECEAWASRNECKNNPQYMLLHCREACNKSYCSLHNGEAQVASMGISPQRMLKTLIENQHYIFTMADRENAAEKLYKQCINKHELCTVWSLRGECSGSVRSICSLACHECDMFL